jgi:uncharacterized protein YkwD
MIRRGGTSWAGLALLGLALAAAGCGSGDSESAAAAAEPSSLEPLTYENGHPLAAPADDPGVLEYESEVTRLVNEHRVLMGLNALADSGSLRDVARAHSKHMIVHRFLGHASPEGFRVRDRLLLADVRGWSKAGENFAAGHETPQKVFRAWLDSPTHRANIESDQWTHIGVGLAVDLAPTEEYPYTYYWTQNFLKP